MSHRKIHSPKRASSLTRREALKVLGSSALMVAAAPLSVTAAAQSPGKESKVILTTEPFPLTDVRLLDGPFREAMLRDQHFLLALDPDRLLHNFRVTAGLESHAEPLGGWEAPNVELRGHSVGHYLSALSLMYASTGDNRFKVRADLIVAELAKVQAAMPSRGFHEGYLSAYPEELIDRVEHGHDHDADPVVVGARYTGTDLDLGFYSRLRSVNPDSSYSVNG